MKQTSSFSFFVYDEKEHKGRRRRIKISAIVEDGKLMSFEWRENPQELFVTLCLSSQRFTPTDDDDKKAKSFIYVSE